MLKFYFRIITLLSNYSHLIIFNNYYIAMNNWKIILPTFVFISIVISCSSTDTTYKQNIREIKYFQSTIHNIDRNIITLVDGTKWKTYRFVIAVNMTEVFIVVNFLGNGSAYINGTKYSISHIGGGEGFRYFYGYLNTLRSIDKNNNVIFLSDGTQWQIMNSGDIDISKWLLAPDVIISENENYLINPYKIELIRVKRIKENNSRTNALN